MIITISRQLGSGGNAIAKELSEKLEIPYYDKEIIAETASKYGVSKEQLLKSDEKRTNSFLYSLVTAQMTAPANPAIQLNDIISDDRNFLLTADTIKQLAQESCIIVGRCADYILKDRKIVSVFVCANIEDRIMRVKEKMDIPDKNALKLIQKTDKRRASYYNSYTDRVWGEATNYDICINSSALGIDKSAEVIKSFVRQFYDVY